LGSGYCQVNVGIHAGWDPTVIIQSDSRLGDAVRQADLKIDVLAEGEVAVSGLI
jgi:hypothetical protein